MTAGDVVLLEFPFSDLSGSKLRPAVVVAMVGRDDFVACQVTSDRDADSQAIELASDAFSAGGLRVLSYVRPSKLFTAHASIVAKRVGRLKEAVTGQIKDAVVAVVRNG